MKTILASLFVVFPSLTFAQAKDAGRYQLFQGQIERCLPSGCEKQPGVFKIDSATGKVWRYLDSNIDREKNEWSSHFWTEVPDAPVTRKIK